MNIREIKTVDVALAESEVAELVLLKEQESGLYFAVDGSYVEQDVDTVHSPYGHGPCHFPDQSSQKDSLRTRWQKAVASGETVLSLAAWSSSAEAA